MLSLSGTLRQVDYFKQGIQLNFDDGREISDGRPKEGEQKSGVISGTVLGGLATVVLMAFVVT